MEIAYGSATHAENIFNQRLRKSDAGAVVDGKAVAHLRFLSFAVLG
ncbi:hypothetical protein ABE493_04325 [Stenotrophomonas terrae]